MTNDFVALPEVSVILLGDAPENVYSAGNPARDIDGSSMYFIRTKGGGVK